MPASSSREPTLRDLLDALDRLSGTEFHEVELRVGDSRLRVARGPSIAAPAAVPVAAAPVAGAAAVTPAGVSGQASPSVPAEDPEAGLETVTAPMVGTFYRRPRPDAEPFASVGDRVRKGQVLCIIEAMKLMNNIEAECGGELVEIVPEDGSAVQFGDRLFVIRPD